MGGRLLILVRRVGMRFEFPRLVRNPRLKSSVTVTGIQASSAKWIHETAASECAAMKTSGIRYGLTSTISKRFGSSLLRFGRRNGLNIKTRAKRRTIDLSVDLAATCLRTSGEPRKTQLVPGRE